MNTYVGSVIELLSSHPWAILILVAVAGAFATIYLVSSQQEQIQKYHDFVTRLDHWKKFWRKPANQEGHGPTEFDRQYSYLIDLADDLPLCNMLVRAFLRVAVGPSTPQLALNALSYAKVGLQEARLHSEVCKRVRKEHEGTRQHGERYRREQGEAGERLTTCKALLSNCILRVADIMETSQVQMKYHVQKLIECQSTQRDCVPEKDSYESARDALISVVLACMLSGDTAEVEIAFLRDECASGGQVEILLWIAKAYHLSNKLCEVQYPSPAWRKVSEIIVEEIKLTTYGARSPWEMQASRVRLDRAFCLLGSPQWIQVKGYLTEGDVHDMIGLGRSLVALEPHINTLVPDHYVRDHFDLAEYYYQEAVQSYLSKDKTPKRCPKRLLMTGVLELTRISGALNYSIPNYAYSFRNMDDYPDLLNLAHWIGRQTSEHVSSGKDLDQIDGNLKLALDFFRDFRKRIKNDKVICQFCSQLAGHITEAADPSVVKHLRALGFSIDEPDIASTTDNGASKSSAQLSAITY